MSKNSKRCWQLGCQNKGIKCVILGALIDQDENVKNRYCSEHAAENGFCYSCGIFCAGIESFDFGRYHGLCDNYADEVRANDAWDEIDEQEIDPYEAEY